MTTGNPKIYNLRDLVSAIGHQGRSYSDTLKNIQFGFKEVEHLCFWDRDSYSKINIEKDEKYELVLICWEKGQQSPIHNHDTSEAWTYVIKGELTEKIYTKEKESSSLKETLVLHQRDISSIKNENHKSHCLVNSNNGRSVSLHLYKK